VVVNLYARLPTACSGVTGLGGTPSPA